MTKAEKMLPNCRSAACALAVLLATLPAAFAQDCTRTIPVNVLTPDTSQAFPFSPESLHATLKGSPITISRREKLHGNRILVLVDTSGSMADKMPFASDALQVLIENIPAGSSIAYGFFDREPHLSGGFTSDRKELIRDLEQLRSHKAYGQTALLDTLQEGLKLFTPANPGDAVLLITDGGENHSHARESALKKELRDSGVRVFAIMLLDAGISVMPEEALAPNSLRQTAEESGGSVLTIYHNWPTLDRKWLLKVAALVQNFWVEGVAGGYLLTVETPANLTKPSNWNLRLDPSGDKRLKNAIVIYPQKLLPCTATAASAR